MSVALAAFEVMDKEPALWFIFLASFSTGAIGMLAARRRPILSAFFVTVVLLGAFALYLELSDSFVGESIVKEGGFAYLGGCGIAILAGIGMPLLGAFAGTNRVQQSAAAWRWTSGVSGAVLLGLTLFMGSGFVKTVYYDYIFYPKEKAGEGYIMPLRWQDIVAELSIACILIGLLLLSTSLLRLQASKEHRNRCQPLISGVIGQLVFDDFTSTVSALYVSVDCFEHAITKSPDHSPIQIVAL